MTERLSPTDAAFLFLEDSSTPMHVGGVVILQPGRPDFAYSDLVDLISSRLSLVPRFRQRVRFVPGRIARPVWVDDENFDITYHVRRSALPAPGDDAQLAELVGRLISRPLDRTRPLWEVYVIEGLADGRIALVNKTHHAMVDRIGAVDVAAAILDVSPSPRTLPEQAWLPTPAPSDADLVIDALADLTARPSEILDVVRLAAMDVRSTLSGMSSGLSSTVSAAVEMVRRTVRPAPRSPLNVPVSGQRRFSAVAVDLAEVKTIRNAHGGTVNDVILTSLTGALRSWLLSRGEPVTAGTTVRAMLPVSIREAGAGADPVVSYLMDLPVSEPNPVMRLHQVSFAMGAHTDSGQGIGADALMELGRFAPPTLHALGARVGSQLSRRVYNLLITNVPGPQLPLYAAGALVLAMYPVASLAPGQALALAVTSYNGKVYFGLTADRDAMPDIEEFSAHIQEAVDELLATVTPERALRSSASKKAKAQAGQKSARSQRGPAPGGDRAAADRAAADRTAADRTAAESPTAVDIPASGPASAPVGADSVGAAAVPAGAVPAAADGLPHNRVRGRKHA